ncbi:acetoin:2,6-dichlorophenolindophenol oxidoreductase subunit beta [Luminiphilus syltensis NOR5-1B]|uniref:2-oxoisovalerate dehydrogenase subunit beta n=1 Tax=Luminiphilus syltensis NOR5-1B TaxID=565045 RepID=B8KTY9_9GAMM|nr:alpha-ketoacid dehydrogenase subunit beta [Luminiphilus syltensis]EED36389.1 acetoin:2,6-dichlorophenolindophenol oxidoreductase subunit beta [Luminiphilus syltensis NOR5-1B]
MPQMTMREAINHAMRLEMRRDPEVILIGEDVAGGRGCPVDDVEAAGGVMGVTAGLFNEFGEARVIDTPITESAIMGAAAGAALTGMRPIAELMFADFFGVCFDQLYNQAAKFRYMFGGQQGAAMVVRTMIGAGMGSGPQHSQAIYPIFAHIPGLKVVLPSCAYDAKGLLIQSIRDNDPVIFCEHKMLYGDKDEVPEESYQIPLGQARVVREGSDVTVVALGRMVKLAVEAAEALEEKGISTAVIDPRTISPLDVDTILDSVEETGRVVVVDEATPMCSMASEIASMIVSDGFSSLRAPVKKVTAPHTPVPASPVLEAEYAPTAARISAAIESVYAYR